MDNKELELIKEEVLKQSNEIIENFKYIKECL